jgi:transposase
VAALTTGGAALAFLGAVALHAVGLEGLAIAALLGVPGVPLAVLCGLPSWMRRWRQRVVPLRVASPELVFGRHRVRLDEVEEALPVLSERGYALRLSTRGGIVELPLGGHDLPTVHWLVAAVERQRRAHASLTDAHRDALQRLGALRGPPR